MSYSNIGTSLGITYSGTIFKPIIIAMDLPSFYLNGFQQGTSKIDVSFNKTIDSISSNGSNGFSNLYGLTFLSFDDLSYVNNSINLGTMYDLYGLNFPCLIYAQSITLSIFPSMQNLNFPLLTGVNGALSINDVDNISANGAFTGGIPVISFPSLVEIGSLDWIGVGAIACSMPNLTYITKSVGSASQPMSFSSNSLLTGISFPSLKSIPSLNIVETFGLNCTILSMPSLTGVPGTITLGGHLTGVDFTSLQYAGGINPQISQHSGIFSLPNLTVVGGSITLLNSAFTGVSMPNLKYVGGNILTNLSQHSGIFSLPSLTGMGGTIQLATVFSGVFLPNLVSVGPGAMEFSSPRLTGIDLPSLQTNSGSIGIVIFGDPTYILSSFNAPNFVYLAGGINISSLTNLTNLHLGTSGITKFFSGNYYFGFNSLSQGSVDSGLNFIASMDGTNGTNVWGNGLSADFSGGLNATPSIKGSGAIFLITGRGGIVNYNT